MIKSTTLFLSAIVPLIAGMCVATSSNAQSNVSDAEYCHTLSMQFTKAGGVAAPGGNTTIPLVASVAIAQCQDNPGESIPVLEQQLRDNRIALPPRS